MEHFTFFHVLLHLLWDRIDSQSCYHHTQSLPVPMYGHVAVYSEYSNSVYLFGGKTTTSYLDIVYQWNLNNGNSWFQQIGSTPTRPFFSYGNNAVVVDNIIYFVGMEDTTVASGNIYRYDIPTESWLDSTSLSAPTIPLSHGCLSTNGTHIFMIDGYNGNTSQNREAVIQVYNIATDTWGGWYLGSGTFTFIGGWRYQYCSMVNNELFILGGRTGSPKYTDRIYKIDVITEHLTFVGYLPISQSWGVATYFNNFIYTVGGFPFNININAFDVRTETVSNTFYKMTEELSAPASLVLNNTLYVFGGENNSFAEVSDVQICDLVTPDLTSIPTTTTTTPSTPSPTTTYPTTAQPTLSPITITTTIGVMSTANDVDVTVITEIDKNNANGGNSKADNLVAMLGIVGISILCLILLFCVLIYIRVKKTSQDEFEQDTTKLSKYNLDAVRSVSSQSPPVSPVYRISSAQSVTSVSAVKPKYVDVIELVKTEYALPQSSIVAMQSNKETPMVTPPGGVPGDEGVNTDYGKEGVMTKGTPGAEMYEIHGNESNGNDCDVDLLDDVDINQSCMQSD